MKNKNYDDLKAIRSMMEQSSRFISLSGWSGIMAGIYALIAAGIARYLLNDFIISSGIEVGDKLIIQLCVLAFVTLISAVGTGLFLSIRKSKNHNLKIWSKPAKNMLIHLSVPLIAGGLFVIALYINYSNIILAAPVTLIFYGLALVNASKVTFQDVLYLGYCQIALGIIGLFIPGYGLLLWAIGFGVLHIIYGILIQRKYQ